MDLEEGLMPSKINQAEKETLYDITYMWILKIKQ